MSDDTKNPNQLSEEDLSESLPEAQSEEALNTDGDSKHVLDDLDELGGLEVASMPESNELQERRRKTKNRLQELSTIQDESESGEGTAFDEEESGLMDLLREMNLSGKTLKSCLGVIVGLGVLVGLFFGAKALLQAWQDRPVEENPVEDPQNPQEPDEDYSFLDPTLYSGILIGEDEPEQDPSTEVGENLGDNEDETDLLTTSINDFALIFEVLQVDVNELLNQSSNRYEAIDDHLNELNYLQYLGRQNLADLEESSDNLVQKFNSIEEAKSENEERFFLELQDLDAPAALSALNAFIAQGEDIVRLRAEFNARQKLIGYYEQALEALATRQKDIELNKEALVKGVQVVEVEGSTLDLILDEDEL